MAGNSRTKLWTMAAASGQRPVLTVVVGLGSVDDARLSEVMGGLVDRLGMADPRPVRSVAVVEGLLRGSEDLVDTVPAAVQPFWQRPPV